MKGISFRVKIVVAVVVTLAIYGVLKQYNLVPSAVKQQAAVPTQFELPTDAPATNGTVNVSNIEKVALPTTKVVPPHTPLIRLNIWAWNAQMGLLFANGGPLTTSGSLMEKHGVTLKIARQDDTTKTQDEQLRFATAVSKGSDTPGEGVQFGIIMGDGAAQYLAAMNKNLTKLGPDYRAEVIGAVGYSRGEDAWWGPQDWRDDASKMRGGATAGVLRDGDWNIAQYKLANDGIKNNPDETTYDPDAMNWFAADDYVKAAQMYVSNYCEDRPVVRNGKLSSEPKHRTCVQGVVTWTPGDVTMAKGRGGLVRLLSTAENVYQMPAVIIGIHKWDVAHAKQIEGLLAAVFEGSDQVRAYPEALSRAAQASFSVYAEQTPAYWSKYYRGVIERDRTNQPVPLGGSSVMNLSDNAVLFGLAEGSGGITNSLFNATYAGFGKIVTQQYPRLVPSFPPTEEAVNTQFIQSLLQKAPSAAVLNASNADLQTFDSAEPIQRENIVATKNWTINFDTGKATFAPDAESTLRELYNQLVVGGALAVEIDGHTDNVGDAIRNKQLSQARAEAVQQWLVNKAPALFPQNRVTVRAFGDSQPIAPNQTPDGRAKNRRVTVVLASKS